MAPHFKEIVCVFMYFVPGLEHQEKFIRWAKAKYPNTSFIQVPHWNLSYIFRSGMFCVPKPKQKLLKLSDIKQSIQFQTGIHHVFLGMKKADSFNRRLMLNRMGEPYMQNGYVYPLADWTNKDVLAYARQKALPEPIRYSKKASGGCGFNEECFVFLRENYPQDHEKIIKAFPMSEKILYDYDNKPKP